MSVKLISTSVRGVVGAAIIALLFSVVSPGTTAFAAPITSGVSASATKTTDQNAVKAVVKMTAKKASNLHKGSKGPNVKLLQQRLDANKSNGGYFRFKGDYSTTFGSATLAGLKKWQKANHYKATGKITVGSKQWKKLAAGVKKTKSAAAQHLDKRCLTGVLTLCASKASKQLLVVRGGKILADLSARFGRPGYSTREGKFNILRISGANATSSIYHVKMPYAMTFSGGQAVHYSPNFKKVGYRGPGSHGCVNLRDYAGTRWINYKVTLGVLVVVTRS